VSTAAITSNGRQRTNGETAPDGRRKLRVCMVHFSRFELDSRVQRQARSLADQGHEVHCICLDGPGRFVVGDGVIRTYSVGRMKPRAGALNYVRGYAHFFARALRRVTALDRLHPLDLVEVHNMPDFLTFAGLRPKLRGVPVLLDVHDTFPELFASKFGYEPDHPFVRGIRTEERLSAGFADRMLVVTEEARERLNSRGVGVGKTHVVMNSPDERVFGPPRESVIPPRDGKVRVVYHGGVAERFGVESLVRAAALLADDLPGAWFDIFGACSIDGARVRSLAREIAPRVNVAEEPTPFGEIPGKLEGAHVGVVPTLRDDFTELLLPVKLLEYVHLGIPVVVSRLPVTERYFDADQVRFFEPGSPESLAAAIRDICSNPEAAAARADRAQERLKDFAWARQRENYLSVIESLTAKSRQAPLTV
jgi:glycosyltransferase involved in cell wall biosynthesis